VARRLRRSPALRAARLAQPVDDSPHVVGAPAAQARDDRAVQPVQEALPAPAADEQGDEVARFPVAENLHHAFRLRKVHTGPHALKTRDLRDDVHFRASLRCPVAGGPAEKPRATIAPASPESFDSRHE
jgi:hypothetical protein